MKAVVLAGGYATRLWPITRYRPKMLLPVGERTVLDRILDDVESERRIEDVYLSTNERFAPEFRDHIDRTGRSGPHLSVEDSTGEDEKFGVVGALAQLVDRENLHGEDIVIVAGDNLMNFGIGEFLDFFESREGPTLAAYDVDSREQATNYGLIDLEADRVVDFQEKPDEPPSTLVSVACYAFPAESVRFDDYLSAGNNPDEPGWFIQWLVDRRDVYAFTFDGAWFDIGTPESYLAAVSWVLGGKSVVHADASLENADIGPNVHVMSGATVRGASPDRTLVFPGATVENASVQDSLIDSHALVKDTNIAGGIVGPHSQIR